METNPEEDPTSSVNPNTRVGIRLTLGAGAEIDFAQSSKVSAAVLVHSLIRMASNNPVLVEIVDITTGEVESVNELPLEDLHGFLCSRGEVVLGKPLPDNNLVIAPASTLK